MPQPSLITTIRSETLTVIKNLTAIEAGFGTGPSFVAGEVTRFDPPADLETALNWVERYRHVLRSAHVMLNDRTVLWFDRNGYTKYDNDPVIAPPRLGITVSCLQPSGGSGEHSGSYE